MIRSLKSNPQKKIGSVGALRKYIANFPDSMPLQVSFDNWLELWVGRDDSRNNRKVLCIGESSDKIPNRF